MNTSFDSIATRAETQVALHLVNGVPKSPIVYTSVVVVIVTVAVAAVVLSGFEDGRKALQPIVSFIDSILGGAPHAVTLPGPPGLPLVGNLFEVSCL